MIHVDYEKCVGCAACANICPQKCIEMVQNEEGFYYPSVDTQKCVSCSLCNKVCLLEAAPAQNNMEPLQTFAAYAKDDAVRAGSSSGGVFYYLANYVFSIGGVVFGAAFSEDLTVHHVCAKNLQELKPLMRSKYVQSRVGDSYAQVRSYLTQGIPVLFTGTPCQIDGLKAYLRQEYDCLYAVSIVCHGTPSENVWKKYLKYMQAEQLPDSVSFRGKTHGWLDFEMEIGSYASAFSKDPYMQLFLGNFTLRPSCYDCPSKKRNAARSDLSIADFWGIQQIDPSMFDNKGTSLILVYTQKGAALLQKIQSAFVLKPENYSDALHYNTPIIGSVQMPVRRAACMQELNAVEVPDFEQIAKKYCAPRRSGLRLLKRAAKKVLRVLHLR